MTYLFKKHDRVRIKNHARNKAGHFATVKEDQLPHEQVVVVNVDDDSFNCWRSYHIGYVELVEKEDSSKSDEVSSLTAAQQEVYRAAVVLHMAQKRFELALEKANGK